jgi:hypothetical protein
MSHRQTVKPPYRRLSGAHVDEVIGEEPLTHWPHATPDL